MIPSMKTDQPTPTEKSTARKLPKISKKSLVVFLVTIILAAGAYYFKGQFIVALVNGQPISRLTLIKELEKQSGEGTLEALVTKALVLQEAEKQGVSVSDEEVGQEIAQIEENLGAQGQNLDQVLGMQGISREDLEEQIRMQKTAEKIAGGDLEVTDEEVENYFTENQDSFSEEAEEEEIKKNIRQQLEQRKLSAAINSLINSLREGADINYLREF